MTTFAKFSGLHTSHNYVGSVPAGAMSLANNVVISSLDTVEPRRGQYSLSYGFGSASDRANAVWNYGTSLLVQYGTRIAYDDGSAFFDYSGTFTPVDDALCRMRGIEAAQSFYVNTATGVKVLNRVDDSFSDAGVPQCLDIWEVGATTSSSGFLASDKAVAYRALVGQYDNRNGRWHYGSPSQRTVVTNTPIVIAVGLSMERAANVVTVTLSATDQSLKYLAVGNTVSLTTSEANFASGTKTITAINTDITANWFRYSEAGADATSTVEHSFTLSARSSKVAIGIPTGLSSSSDVVQLFRSKVAATASTDPGEELYQVAEVAVPAVAVAGTGVISSSAVTGKIVVTHVGHGYSVGQSIYNSVTENSFTEGTYIITETTANTYTFQPGGTVNTFVNAVDHTFTPRTVVVEDNTPDVLLGDPLYTNPNTGRGAEASRYEPPVSKDMCKGGGRLWWLNTTWKHRFSLELLGVGSPSGIQNNDTISFTVNGTAYTYTASTALNSTVPSARVFAVHTYSSPSVNIERTALELVRCINQGLPSLPFYAVYTSVPSDPRPGRIDIIEKGLGGYAIQPWASRQASWNPLLPSSASSSTTSDNSSNSAGVCWSETDDVESWLLGNQLTVGDDNDPIYRGVWLRDTLFAFKKQGGVHIIPNQLPFRPRELDPTCHVLAPDSVVTLNNQIFALTDQGLVTVTEGGVDIIGWPLDYDFRSLINTARSAITRIPFAVAYESERQLWLWLPSSNSDTYATQVYIYNHATRAFTRVSVERRCGTVMPGTDILWMGSATSNTLVRERKSFNETDNADETFTVTLNAVSGTTLTLSSTANIEAGDLLSDTAGHGAYVESVVGSTVVTSSVQTWVVPSTLTVTRGFLCELAFVPQALGAPGTGKAVPAAVYTFRQAPFHYGKATISTDEEPATSEYTLTVSSGYGEVAYGTSRYGDRQDNVNRYVTLGANGSLVTLGFKIRQARAKWQLLAVTAQTDPQSERGP